MVEFHQERQERGKVHLKPRHVKMPNEQPLSQRPEELTPDIVNVNAPKDKMMIIQRELVATYNYEIQEQVEPFYFRLEIYKQSDIFKGIVFRLERYRLIPTFPQDQNGESVSNIDDALLYIKDEFIDDTDLFGKSEDIVVSIFIDKLKYIFNLNDGG